VDIIFGYPYAGRNGIDGIKPIRRNFRKVPIVVLSASSDMSDSVPRELGALALANKASLAEEMIAWISRVLEGKTCFPDELDLCATQKKV
jgi:DNA-binding NarL/FixJ family response regulator